MTDNDLTAALGSGTSAGEREARLTEGADELAARSRGSILRHPRFLLWVSVTLMTLGITLILLGWAGASRSIVVEEQVPYLISGGLLGLALALIGAVTLFAQWLTTLIREEREREVARRRDHEELVEALQALAGPKTRQGGGNGNTRGARANRPVRRTSRG
jgi:hypothetical protein